MEVLRKIWTVLKAPVHRYFIDWFLILICLLFLHNTAPIIVYSLAPSITVLFVGFLFLTATHIKNQQIMLKIFSVETFLVGIKVFCLLISCLLPIFGINYLIVDSAKLLLALLYFIFFFFPAILYAICTYTKTTYQEFAFFWKKNISCFFSFAFWCGAIIFLFNESGQCIIRIANQYSSSPQFLFACAICYFILVLYVFFVFAAILGVIACDCKTSQQKEENK